MKSTQKGFSLVQVMIAMSLGTVVIMGVFSALSTLKPHFRYQANLVHIQENMRMLDVLLGSKIKYESSIGIQGTDMNHLPFSLLRHYRQVELSDLTQELKPGSDILKFMHLDDTQVLYIVLRDTQRLNEQDDPIYSIYQYSKAEGRGELIEGVKELQFRFGIPTDTGITYYPYEHVTNPTLIKMLRVKVLLVSLDNKMEKYFQQDYQIGKN